MRRNAHDVMRERLEEVLALVRVRVARDEQAAVASFVPEYYRQVDPEDLAARAPEDLYGAALSHWNFARRRAPGREKVRVFSPTAEEHGWQSTHSVVEIVNDDMPFLVDSVTMAVNRRGLALHLLIHPVLAVVRDAGGRLAGLAAAGAKDAPRESFVHVEVDRLGEPAEAGRLAADITRALADVRAAVADWQPMRERMAEVIAELAHRPATVAAEDLGEARAFLEWLADNHFTFVGYRCHDLVTVDGEDGLRAVPGSGLGILRETAAGRMSASFAKLPPRVRERARAPEVLVVTKSNSRSTVHRSGYLDYVGVKRFDERGAVRGEHRFLGLYTSAAYMAPPGQIPLLRRKVASVIARAGLMPQSHAAKALVNILDAYPRDELFQIDEDELLETATGILQLEERQRIRLFVRRDPFDRFLSCLIYTPRERYDTTLRRKWQAILAQAFAGDASDFGVFLSESALARVLITVRTTPGAVPQYDVREIEVRLAAAARRWEDDLKDALAAALGEARGNALCAAYGGAFPAGYREDFAARSAVADIETMARLTEAEPLGLSLYRPPEAAPGSARFKLFRRGAPLPLSDSLPMLERMGLRVLEERPYRILSESAAPVWLHDFGLIAGEGAELDLEAVDAIFVDAFARVYRGEVENDDFNRLVLGARLAADEVVILRAYARYLQQLGFGLPQSFIQQTLAAHPGVARMLVNLFKLRFDPDGAGAGADPATADRQAQAIEAALEKVANLNEDRVLRQYLALVLATVRTNWFRTDGGARRPFLSFKLDPSRIPGMPEPKPMFEIFVYSPRFEGVHLRGGKVARGGLRWSDRPEDFRTEVLGLVKAQMVKNAVIVPVGSKGGFVLKRAPSPADREAYLKEGVACYRDYLRGLLDLTDNLAGGKVVPPPGVRRHDPDDPYLVVAADKGTATFSDHANGVAAEYGFWLGDAFASGGSAGYDHKGMGITARGAWESVKRHFREIGFDTQSADFTVVGIGDMSGDVFGNGMLRSERIRLVAAFDHRHIFIDPDPDAATGFEERKRLFALPRSSWADYRADLISKGGGVWPRSAKSIPLSPEARRALGVEAGELAPNALVSAILEAPVDLLYNGGIGTYVKARDETHAEVGDRANDAVRVNGAALRCKVVAEGGNLGFTQRGRIEYALAGGRINTDAIDNSAGVDTSDHEVNIKILLGLAIADGELTGKQRNQLLAAATGDVATLVLRDNYFQTQSLSVVRRMGPKLLDAQARFIRFLEKSGRLNRALEFLPDEEALAERRARGIGLTAPELAVLLAYSKLWLCDELLASPFLEDPWAAAALERYFPIALSTRFAAYMPRHPLRREITATHIVNGMVNRVGSTFVHGLMESTGARPHEIVRAYLQQREIFDYVALWRAIESLDGQVPDEAQAEMLIEAARLTVRATVWLLRSKRLADGIAATVAHFRPGVEKLAGRLPQLLDAQSRANLDGRAAALAGRAVPAPLAQRVASLENLFSALDIVEIAGACGRSVETVATVYFRLSAELGLPWLRERIGLLPADGHWPALARGAMRDDLAGLQRTLTAEAMAHAEEAAEPDALIAAWWRGKGDRLERARHLLEEMKSGPAPDLPILSVALRELRNLAQ
ncbi:MAG: NAD-glutamate dehydrogenase [Burkholderiales bacterium]|nr:NAD-glutamate dehydrogenase [Burkholderiales bacterium]